MNKTNVSIVLYNNKKELIEETIISVLKNKEFLNKLYLVDNSPKDELSYLKEKFEIDYIFNGKNLGFGAAHNIALKMTEQHSISYHLVLNPDVYFGEGVFNHLVTFLDSNPDTGQIMPKVLYPNGADQILCKLLPSPYDLIIRRFVSKKLVPGFEISYDQLPVPTPIPFLSGCFMLLRTEALKRTGGFDENFFMYLEDTDLCRRISDHYKTMYYPYTSIFHHFAKGSYSNKKLLKYHLHSAIYYFNKWGWVYDKGRDEKNKEFLKLL